MSLNSLEKELDFKFKKQNILVTYHPVSLDDNPIYGADVLLQVLSKFKSVGMIFTYSNADISGTKIIKKILEFEKYNSNIKVFSNLGQLKYLSCLKYCNGVVGNSSSGIIEAPSLKTWTINIGDRQKGRIRAGSIFDVKIDKKEIKETLNKLLNNSINFEKIDFKNPYSKKNTTNAIFKTLIKINKEKIINKIFFDIKY